MYEGIEKSECEKMQMKCEGEERKSEEGGQHSSDLVRHLDPLPFGICRVDSRGNSGPLIAGPGGIAAVVGGPPPRHAIRGSRLLALVRHLRCPVGLGLGELGACANGWAILVEDEREGDSDGTERGEESTGILVT